MEILIVLVGIGGAFAATRWGVIKGFELNKEKEISNQAEHKKRLILGMLAEMSKIQEYLYFNQSAPPYVNEVFEISLIFDTVQDQTRLFDTLKLAPALFELRRSLMRMEKVISLGFDVTLRGEQFKFSHGNWGSYNSETRRAMEDVRQMFVEEYTGPASDLNEKYLTEWK